MSEFNEHILLVLRWLQNKNTVSKVELKNNSDSAREVYRTAADAKAAARADAAATYAAYVAAAAARAAYVAAYTTKASTYRLSKTKEHLNAYFKLTKEDRDTYEERAKYLNVLGANNA